MRAGLLRHRALFQGKEREDVLPGGQRVPVWSEGTPRWCSIDPLKGDELVTARQVQADVTHKITIRGKPPEALQPKAATLRVQWQGRTFNLVSSLNWQERGVFSTITAIEKLGGVA